MAILNLQTGRQKAVQVLGLKELQQNINALMSAMVGQEAAAVAASGAQIVYDRMDSNLTSAGAPHQVHDDLFIYSKQRSGDPNSVTALVGLRKHGARLPSAGYVTWNAGKQQGAFEKRPRLRKKGTLKFGGQMIGENLGTMWELGTTKMQARPWFRPAVQDSRPDIYAAMVSGYQDIIARHTT